MSKAQRMFTPLPLRRQVRLAGSFRRFTQRNLFGKIKRG